MIHITNIKTHNNKAMFRTVVLIVGLLFTDLTCFAQEKKDFLQNRYNGTSVLITKDFTRTQLNDLKNNLSKEGIVFNYSDLIYNTKNEIIQITLQIKNSKSSSSATWNDNNKPIPTIKTGEINGIVFTTTYLKKTLDKL